MCINAANNNNNKKICMRIELRSFVIYGNKTRNTISVLDPNYFACFFFYSSAFIKKNSQTRGPNNKAFSKGFPR